MCLLMQGHMAMPRLQMPKPRTCTDNDSHIIDDKSLVHVLNHLTECVTPVLLSAHC